MLQQLNRLAPPSGVPPFAAPCLKGKLYSLSCCRYDGKFSTSALRTWAAKTSIPLVIRPR